MPAAGSPRAVSSTCVVIIDGVRAPVDQLLEPQPRDLALLLGRDAQLGVRDRVAIGASSDREHLARRVLPGRADDENVAEARLVVAVRRRQPARARHRPRRRRRACSCADHVASARLPTAPSAPPTSAAPDPPRPNPRMRGERLEPVGGRSSAAPDAHRPSSAIASTLGERPRGRHRARPARRAAAAQQLARRRRSRSSAFRLGRAACSESSPRARGSAVDHRGRPNSRSRPTPPSGKMLNRTCVTSPIARSSSSKVCRACGCSGVRGSSSRHSTPAGDGSAVAPAVGTPRGCTRRARCP